MGIPFPGVDRSIALRLPRRTADAPALPDGAPSKSPVARVSSKYQLAQIVQSQNRSSLRCDRRGIAPVSSRSGHKKTPVKILAFLLATLTRLKTILYIFQGGLLICLL
jgi:hypothetical protein